MLVRNSGLNWPKLVRTNRNLEQKCIKRKGPKVAGRTRTGTGAYAS